MSSMKYILHPHAQSITKVLSSLHSSQSGLTNVQVVRRKKDNKLNVLPSSNQFISSLSLLFSQLKSPLIILLIIAGIVSGSLGEIIDMSVILGTAGINILVGFFQEYKANSAIRELQKMVQQYAIVLRDKKKLRIDISEIVTGDIVYVEAGNSIPGDGRVIESSYLEVDESSLTGESISIKKHTKVLPMNIQYTDQKNMVFKGTKVTAGNGYIVITAIGQQTILGGIATLVSEVSEGFTPLQKQVNKLSVFIGYVVIGIAIMIFFLGILTNNSGTYTALQLFETAVAVAIAAIPEGLAISLTIILAIGMKFIAKKKALVRRLVAAETLGSVNVICTDKTGTITEGKMRVEFFEFDSQKVSSEQLDQLTIDTIEEGSNMQYALQIGALANTAVYEANLEQYLGDTTDVAFAALSFQLGYAKERLETLYPIVDTIPFSSETKYIGSLHKFKRQHTLFIKGATEILLGNSTHILRNGKKISITENNKKYFLDLVSKYSSQGYRIIGLAYKQFDHKKTSKIIVEDLVFVGLAVLSDPVRKGVAEILVKTSTAGIKTIMITGDYANTALSIAKQIGLPHQANNIIAGEQLESMTDKELIACIDNIYIFARANPNHKIRIVKALQSKGNVVAMTGDGVNDAPAIKAADIGIAVGSGTDVAKQTADIILLDDSLITIVETIEQGRGIYENIQKVILYLLVGSFAEVILISTILFNPIGLKTTIGSGGAYVHSCRLYCDNSWMYVRMGRF